MHSTRGYIIPSLGEHNVKSLEARLSRYIPDQRVHNPRFQVHSAQSLEVRLGQYILDKKYPPPSNLSAKSQQAKSNTRSAYTQQEGEKSQPS